MTTFTARYGVAELKRRLALAFDRVGAIDEYGYRVGGLAARLRCAGTTLAGRLTPALAHLAVPVPSAPDITVCAWDAAATGVTLPALPDALAAYLARGEVRGYVEDGIRVAYQFDARALSLFDTKEGTAFYAVADATRLPPYLDAMPLRDIWHWTCRQHGRQLVHAGAVGTERGGVLLAGRGGSGKSTTALACLVAGLRYLSDDYCLLANISRPITYSLYQTGKLDAGHVRRFPELAPLTAIESASGGDKALFFLRKHFPGQMATEMPLRAILLPHVAGQRETTLRPATPAEAVQALAPSTIFQLPGGGSADFRFLAQVARRLPCYRLALGTEIARIPQVIRALLEQLPDA